MERIDQILEYWFSNLDENTRLKTDSPLFRRWFGKDEATDREIRERFEQDFLRAVPGEFDNWEGSPRGSLALVLLFDQFPRNMFRGTSRAFQTDPRALTICLRSIEEGFDRRLILIQRMFLYMPMMHAESIEVQEKSKQHFGMLVEEARQKSSVNVEFFAYSYEYAVKHAVIIERFGRYPHRNESLGRESTLAEIEFLKGPDSSF
jgi:uncharacterized protein (DUF924 family)